MKRLLTLIMFCVLVISACGDDDSDGDGATATRNVTAVPTVSLAPATPTIPPDIRPTLETGFDELQTAQETIAGIWSSLQSGEEVSCADELPEFGLPQAYQGDDAVSVLLFSAAAHLDTAYRLWEAECQNPRSQPPAEIIDQGLREALSAGDDLKDAEAILEG
ncbi:MAG: hypothetical protein L0154_05935 [Chloroflexi bacterium]|nr:hypothetical protein [Chloroflexota bacterium]